MKHARGKSTHLCILKHNDCNFLDFLQLSYSSFQLKQTQGQWYLLLEVQVEIKEIFKITSNDFKMPHLN